MKWVIAFLIICSPFFFFWLWYYIFCKCLQCMLNSYSAVLVYFFLYLQMSLGIWLQLILTYIINRAIFDNCRAGDMNGIIIKSDSDQPHSLWRRDQRLHDTMYFFLSHILMDSVCWIAKKKKFYPTSSVLSYIFWEISFSP